MSGSRRQPPAQGDRIHDEWVASSPQSGDADTPADSPVSGWDRQPDDRERDPRPRSGGRGGPDESTVRHPRPPSQVPYPAAGRDRARPGRDQPGRDQPGRDQPGRDQPAAAPQAAGPDDPTIRSARPAAARQPGADDAIVPGARPPRPRERPARPASYPPPAGDPGQGADRRLDMRAGDRDPADWERNPDDWYRPASDPVVPQGPAGGRVQGPAPRETPTERRGYGRPQDRQPRAGGRPPIDDRRQSAGRPPSGRYQDRTPAGRPPAGRTPAGRPADDRGAAEPRSDDRRGAGRVPATQAWYPAPVPDEGYWGRDGAGAGQEQGAALREPRPAVRRAPPPRTPSAPAKRHRHPWAMIVVLSVGLIVAVYGLVRFGYGPQGKHHVAERPRSSVTSAKKKPEGVPTFPLPKGFVGMAVNPPYSTSLPAVKNVLGRDPQVVETYFGFPGTFPLDQIEQLDAQKILPLVQINPKHVSLHLVASGHYDKDIIALADAVKRVHAPVALSFAHEMNGWWYPWSVRIPNTQQVNNRPLFFRAAWRHVWKVFQAQDVTNVTWVWTVSRDGQRAGWPDLQSWWPGPKYVDWIGMNGYYRAPGQTFNYLYKDQLAILKSFAPHKPVLITETGVGPGPTQHTQIENLFAGIKRTGLLGFIWFDLNADEHWNIDNNQVAIQAFRDGLTNYGY